jgi:hypothetical protein
MLLRLGRVRRSRSGCLGNGNSIASKCIASRELIRSKRNGSHGFREERAIEGSYGY